jgi:uncharacterized protein YraI
VKARHPHHQQTTSHQRIIRMNGKLILRVLFVTLLLAVAAQARKHYSHNVMSDSYTQQSMCATSALNLRASPCTNARVLTTIPTGNQLTSTGEKQTGCGHNWVKVNYKGTVGWSASQYLTGCGGSTGGGSSGGINLSKYSTSYSTSGFTFGGSKAQTLHFLKERFGASGTTYNGHSNGALGSSDLWCPNARYANDNRNNSCMNQMADFIAANLRGLKLEYVIWKQRIYHVGNGYWRQMENRGSITQNHFDHVHITFA